MGFYFPLFYPHSSGNTGKSRMRSWRRDKEEIIWETNKRREEGRKKKVPRFRKREKVTRDKARKERKRKKEKERKRKAKKTCRWSRASRFSFVFFSGKFNLGETRSDDEIFLLFLSFKTKKERKCKTGKCFSSFIWSQFLLNEMYLEIYYFCNKVELRFFL